MSYLMSEFGIRKEILEGNSKNIVYSTSQVFCLLGCGKTLWLTKSSSTNSPHLKFLNRILDKCDLVDIGFLLRCESSTSVQVSQGENNGIKALSVFLAHPYLKLKLKVF